MDTYCLTFLQYKPGFGSRAHFWLTEYFSILKIFGPYLTHLVAHSESFKPQSTLLRVSIHPSPFKRAHFIPNIEKWARWKWNFNIILANCGPDYSWFRIVSLYNLSYQHIIPSYSSWHLWFQYSTLRKQNCITLKICCRWGVFSWHHSFESHVWLRIYGETNYQISKYNVKCTC